MLPFNSPAMIATHAPALYIQWGEGHPLRLLHVMDGKQSIISATITEQASLPAERKTAYLLLAWVRCM